MLETDCVGERFAFSVIFGFIFVILKWTHYYCCWINVSSSSI